MLTSGRYKGNPVAVHLRLKAIKLQHFERWLAMFDDTYQELLDASVADGFRVKAVRIAESLKLASFYRLDRAWHANPQ